MISEAATDLSVRGVELARNGVHRADPGPMSLFARSLAHEVVAACEVSPISDASELNQIADIWGRAARNGGYPLSDVIQWVNGRYPIDYTSGLQRLGWASWRDAIRSILDIPHGCDEVGVDMLAEMLDLEFEAQAITRFIDLIPSDAVVSLAYVPGWDGLDKAELLSDFGLRFGPGERGIATVRKDARFFSMLRFFNIGLSDLDSEVSLHDEAIGRSYAASLEALTPAQVEELRWVDRARSACMKASDLALMLEEAVPGAFPVVFFKARVRELLAQDDGRPIVLVNEEGAYVVGVCDPIVRGQGSVERVALADPLRIDPVSGVVLACASLGCAEEMLEGFPEADLMVSLRQESEDQLDVSRMIRRICHE